MAPLDLSEYLGLARARWRLLAIVLVLGAAIAGGFALRMTPLYTSTIELFVSTPANEDVAAAYQGNLLSQQRVTSYAELLDGELVAQRVIDRLDLSTSTQELIAQIQAFARLDTVILTAEVTDPSPQRAQLIAGTLAQEFADVVAELETQAGTTTASATITTVKQANLPISPASPNIPLYVGLGALLGLLFGGGLVILRHVLDNTVKVDGDVQDATGSVMIGAVMFDARMAQSPLVTNTAGHSQTAEAYRQIRTNLQFLDVDNPPRVLVVTSAVPGEGKTTTAINLALVLAQSGERVALVEADLRRPRIAKYMRLVQGAGLTSVLAGTADVAEVTQPFRDGKLSFLAAGPIPPNPSELLGSAHMREILRELRETHDYVVLDAPPLLPVTDAAVLAGHADGALIVSRHGKTKIEQLRLAAASLRAVEARVLGTILNMVSSKSAASYGYGYGYGYASDKSSRHTKSTKSSAESRKKRAEYDTAPVPAVRTEQAPMVGDQHPRPRPHPRPGTGAAHTDQGR